MRKAIASTALAGGLILAPLTAVAAPAYAAGPSAVVAASSQSNGDDNSGRWGLAGLAGLLGLFGYKKYKAYRATTRADEGPGSGRP